MKRRANSTLFKNVYEQPYSETSRLKLYKSTKGSLDLVQRLCLLKTLPVHSGCVNSICWNETGEYILSGSDDQHLVVTHGYNFKVLINYKTSHRANIFSAKFLPNSGDNNIISCSGDGIILYTDLMRKEETYYNQFNCHSGTTYEVITIPNDPHSFLSCGEDGTVRWFDLRIKDKCNKPQCKEDVMITCQRAVTALSVNPVAPYQLAIGCSDSTVRMFDRRMLGTKASGTLRPLCSFTVPSFEDRSYRITSLTFSPEGEEILVSYSSDHLYLFCVKDHSSVQLKTGTSEMPSPQESDKKSLQRSPPPVRRLRLRGDWSDTGPDARPEREGGRRGDLMRKEETYYNQFNCHSGTTYEVITIPNDPHSFLSCGEDGTVRWFDLRIKDKCNKPQCKEDHSSVQLKTGTSEMPSPQESDKKSLQRSPPPVRRLRLRGDWSDTGPDARPEREGGRRGEIAQARPTLHATLMQRMTDVLSRMLNDPATRAALSGGGEDSLEGDENQGAEPQPSTSQSTEALPESSQLQETPPNNTTCEMASTSASISVPQLSSLSIHSSLPETADSNNETIPSTAPHSGSVSTSELPPIENNNALDLSQVPQFSESSTTQPISSDTLGASENNETENKSLLPEHSVPSQEDCSSRSSDSEIVHHNISNLQDQLSTMREGFIERHRSEPAVSLLYSDKSSTGAKISLGLGDEVSRELHENNSQDLPSEALFDGEDDLNDSDDDTMLMTTGTRRFIHPIEEHMDEAIAAVRHDKEMMFDEQSILQPAVKQKYIGHRNARTMIKEATFWGSDYVLSGSDCGHVFMWNRYTAELVMLLEADHHVVNCLQPHPVLPLLATSGIDYDVKLWAPLHDEPCFDRNLADISATGRILWNTALKSPVRCAVNVVCVCSQQMVDYKSLLTTPELDD
ncbi:hypothetical protein C0J52_19730 [Blattella germanica]|nr:hypothetical protein C0J52_19730 [Blattella germanica]